MKEKLPSAAWIAYARVGAAVMWLLFAINGQLQANEVRDARFYRQSPQVLSRLSSKVTLHWLDVPLRQVLDRLEQSQGISIWLDRRTDPGRSVSLSLRDVTVEQVLQELTSDDLGYTVAGEVVYIGPKSAASDLRTLLARSHQRVERLDRSIHAHLLSNRPLKLPRLTEPRQALDALAERSSLRIKNLNRVPHDLWPAIDLPAQPTVEQLTLMLVGFDLEWQPERDGRSIRLVPIERPVLVARKHHRARLGALPPGVLSDESVAAANNPNEVWVNARVEEHAILAGRSAPTKATPAAKTHQNRATREVYTLRVEQQPVENVLKQLAQHLQLQLEVDQNVTENDELLARRVSFEVREASLAELLQAVCEPAGLAADRQGDTIRVSRVEVSREPNAD